jgi:predicted lipid-binding transport protein (Tim44 family)
MGEGFQYFDIILLAMVAGFVILRLRSVLGRRTGTERPRDPFRPLPPRDPTARETPTDNVIPLPDTAIPARVVTSAARPASAAAGIAQIRGADPSFDANAFLAGARGAFEIVVHAFAAGDSASLRPLLSDEVYDRFVEAIRQRVAARETQETNLVSIKAVEVEEAELNGRTAFVTVKFVSDQINVTRDAEGKAVDGAPDQVVEKTDYWTFARNTRSQDPNWLLVATRST